MGGASVLLRALAVSHVLVGLRTSTPALGFVTERARRRWSLPASVKTIRFFNSQADVLWVQVAHPSTLTLTRKAIESLWNLQLETVHRVHVLQQAV